MDFLPGREIRMFSLGEYFIFSPENVWRQLLMMELVVVVKFFGCSA